MLQLTHSWTVKAANWAPQSPSCSSKSPSPSLPGRLLDLLFVPDDNVPPLFPFRLCTTGGEGALLLGGGDLEMQLRGARTVGEDGMWYAEDHRP